MNYLDLFSGIGGFHLGLKMAGFSFNWVGYSDIDDYANKVYAKNFPNAVPLGDITKINPEDLPEIDIVTAGFPCQDISVAGKQGGLNAKRSGLFYEIIRLCSVVRPKVIFLENVSNLLNGNGGEWMRAVLTALAEIGYDAEWEVIRASDVGAPHRRARVWIVAYPQSDGRAAAQEGKSTKKTIREPARQNNSLNTPGTGCLSAAETDVAESICPGLQGEGQKKIGRLQMQGRGPQFTGKDLSRAWKGSHPEPAICRVANGIPNRSYRLRCLGNAVVPQCVELVGRMILKSGLLERN